jgi:hypothetical protein
MLCPNSSFARHVAVQRLQQLRGSRRSNRRHPGMRARKYMAFDFQIVVFKLTGQQ